MCNVCFSYCCINTNVGEGTTYCSSLKAVRGVTVKLSLGGDQCVNYIHFKNLAQSHFWLLIHDTFRLLVKILIPHNHVTLRVRAINVYFSTCVHLFLLGSINAYFSILKCMDICAIATVVSKDHCLSVEH